MVQFTYEAVDAKGKKIKADIEAGTTQEAISKLHGMGYFPTNVKEKSALAGAGKTAAGLKAPVKARRRTYFGGVKKKQLAQFTTQLSILQDAGLPIVRSIHILEGQMRPGLLKAILGQVAEDVESGSSLSEALGRHPKAFDKLYVNMVKAGEAGGVLDTILTRLAQYQEKAEKLKRKVIAASIYPAAVISIAVMIVTLIMIYVIPQFERVFQDMGTTLPPLTDFLLQASRLIAGGGWAVILFAPIGGWIGLKLMGRNRAGKLVIDKFKLSMPLFGTIIKKATIARFCRTLGTLITSGVPILEALSIVKNAIGNEVVATSVQRVHDSIREGESIAEPLAQTKIFDDIVINMIDVGEETGELDKMLIKIADTYDDEVDTAVGGLMSIMEPVMIIGMGGTIGLIVIALFLPLVDLINKMK